MRSGLVEAWLVEGLSDESTAMSWNQMMAFLKRLHTQACGIECRTKQGCTRLSVNDSFRAQLNE
jgi:hypothetical protein